MSDVRRIRMRSISSNSKAAFHFIKGKVERIRRKAFGPITHVSTNLNLVALTFDDGPHPEYTPQLLAILRRYGVKATFFMVGEAAKRHPAIVKMVSTDGHAIGNHTLNHLALPTLTNEARREQIKACSDILGPHEVRLFRPPYGSENILSHLGACRLGYQVIKWNVAAVDWEDHPATWIATRVVRQIKPGAIVVMHDNLYGKPDPRREPTLGAVDTILHDLSQTFRFCTVPELLRCGKAMTSFELIGRT
jgi:peptidoglycan/xylan/chitin deacetylase (PgdA/CDA1 family)